MGVMACDRQGCKNIMCGRYSHQYGYICSECFQELVTLNMSSIKDFMNTERPEPDLSEEAYQKFDREFPFTSNSESIL